MEDSDRIWNRAALDDGGKQPRRGDVALASLLYAHGLVMNGGVLYAAELLEDEQLSAAQDGYRFFGFNAIADMLADSRIIAASGAATGDVESRLNADYQRYIEDDSTLCERFERHFRSNRDDFAPL